MTWGAVAIGVGTLGAGALTSMSTADATKDAGARAGAAGAQSEAINAERFGDYQQNMNPFMERELTASNQLMYELGMSPYMGAPGTVPGSPGVEATPEQLAQIEALRMKIAGDTGGSLQFEGQRMDTPQAQEMLRQLESAAGLNIGGGTTPAIRNNAPNEGAPSYQSSPAYMRILEEGRESVNQGAVNSGTLYSGRRGEELKNLGSGVENSFYQNYMSTLQNLANPTATTNVGNAGLNQGVVQGNNAVNTANAQNNYSLANTQAQNALIGDAVGGVTGAFNGYMNRPAAPVSPAAQTPSNINFGDGSNFTPGFSGVPTAPAYIGGQ